MGQSTDSILQKKAIDHTTYDAFKTISGGQLSGNGKWAVYEVKPIEGDAWLFLANTESGRLDSFARGSAAMFSSDSKVLVFKILPQAKLVRKAKKDKKKPDEMPKDSLAVFFLEMDSIVKWPRVKSFQLSENSTWVVMGLEKEIPAKKPPVAETKKKRKKKKKPEPAPEEVKSDGLPVSVFDYATGNKKNLDRVTEFALPEKATGLIYTTHVNRKKEDSAYVYTLNVVEKEFSRSLIHSVKGKVKQLAMDEKGAQAAFLSSADTCKTVKVYSLFLKKAIDTEAKLVVDTLTAAMMGTKAPSENRAPKFSSDGKRLFFGTTLIPRKEPEDTLLDEEKHRVDVWTWDDERIMTQQLFELDGDKKFTYYTSYSINDGKITTLFDDSVRTARLVKKGDSPWVLGFSTKGYMVTQTWLSSIGTDVFLINMDNGTRKKVLKGVTHEVSISESGKYIIYYEPLEKQWHTVSTSTLEKTNITKGINDIFYNENNGVPELPAPFGVMGWSAGDAFVYIYSEYDIWKLDPTGKISATCITANEGKQHKNRFRNIQLDNDKNEIEENGLLFWSFYKGDKSESFWSYENGMMNEIYHADLQLQFKGKAKKAEQLLFTRGSFREFPDMWASDTRFKHTVKISNANPQQSMYKWGTVELIKWKSLDGKILEGLLYKPEDFDSTIKYPMLVYYYERNSDNLHQYRIPRPSASIINPTECVSQGYIVFVPDIEYSSSSNPGKDGYNAIISGTKYLLTKGFVNEKKMGLQGQSWGGYQTAFMVTQTNMFAAAMAGAPVSNMTSAYGGVRWESGLVRAFQYEHGQSRIGKSLWEDRESYIRNSALFHLDKVATPLLIMHNDNDGAVPWYQGIELYTGLRRLQKPVWLLNYNGDKHNLMRIPNRRDLSIRMTQFFDHYLKDAPAPKWMVDGVPAVDKGKENGYELVKPEKEEDKK
ncbi:MAG: alpha/beta hydrolase family protein [Flavobacteriales bacterium]